MRWPGQIPAGAKCTEVAATIDILPTLAKLCGGNLSENKIDGHDIWSLMAGKKKAKSPHKEYVLMHGPGTVRSGKWKFYPWKEGTGGRRDAVIPDGRKASPLPTQLYDTDADIAKVIKNGVPRTTMKQLGEALTEVADADRHRSRPCYGIPRRLLLSSRMTATTQLLCSLNIWSKRIA